MNAADERIMNWMLLSKKVHAYGYDIIDGRIKRPDGKTVGKIVFEGTKVKVFRQE